MPIFKTSLKSLLLSGCLFLCSCHREPMAGKLEISFSFTFNGNVITFNNQEYKIESGNLVKIADIRYFISDLQLVDKQGRRYGFSHAGNNVHYVDSRIASTCRWVSDEPLPTGVYEYVEFVYGLDSIQNRSGRFLNPPEADMAWPEVLGGGYHYMQINGYWAASVSDTVFKPFGLHTGKGQADTETGTVFYDNHVRLSDTLRLYVTEGNTTSIAVNMEVAEWFRNPHRWDFGHFGGAVMQNPAAQQVLKDNVAGVFSLH